MSSFARPVKVTPSGLEDQVYQAGIAAKSAPLNAIPNPRSNYRMTLEKALLGHVWREAIAWALAHAEREGQGAVAAAIEADIVDQFPPDDMVVLRRYGFAVSPTFVFVDVTDRTGSRGFVRIPVAGVNAAERALSYVANLDGALPPPSARNSRDVPEQTIPYFRRLVEARAELKDFTRESPTSWVARFKRDKGRVPRWHEIEKAFPVIGEWLDMRRNARG